MEEIQHFAHDHPLTPLRQEERDKRYYICFGCGESISRSDPMYTCKRCLDDRDRRINLHLSCAFLPSKAERYTYAPPPPEQHFRASDHGNLTLIRAFAFCSLCNSVRGHFRYAEKNNGARYFCLNCARFPKTIEHTSHDHPLHLQQKKSTFTCDACDREETGQSYHCASCTFWISKHCASLPNSVLHTSHHHPLTLVGLFRLGEEYTKFDIYCDICGKWVNKNNCVYYCEQCWFYSHVGCATTRSIENEASAESHQTEAVEQMPAPDRSGYLHMVTRLIEKMSSLRSDKSGSQSGQCTSDKHYIVFDAPSDEICDCCVEPISAPYYNCPECHLILHKSCGDLPSQIDHPLHADHPLALLNPSLFDCSRCGYQCTGFAFHCAICSFYLDIRCSSLPTTIKHEAHKHLLSLQKLSDSHCYACYGYIVSDEGYVCTTNCNFSLHLKCALLPRTLTHKYDNHALTLKCKPVGIISKEYYCEICEGNVNPRTWFYYCSRDCDYSFHPSCICRNAQIIFEKVKIGAKIISDTHPCPLTTVLKREMKGGEVSNADVLLECKRCKFKVSWDFCLPRRRNIEIRRLPGGREYLSLR